MRISFSSLIIEILKIKSEYKYLKLKTEIEALREKNKDTY